METKFHTREIIVLYQRLPECGFSDIFGVYIILVFVRFLIFHHDVSIVKLRVFDFLKFRYNLTCFNSKYFLLHSMMFDYRYNELFKFDYNNDDGAENFIL